MLLWNVFIQVLLPILCLLALGWVLDRRFQVDLNTLVKLNIHLVVPAFMFYEVVHSSLDAGLALKVVAFTLSIIACMGLLSIVVARLCGYERGQMRALQLATMFYNSGNYGVPLMTLAFPGVGPLLQVFVILTQNISSFTIGIFLASSAGKGPRERWTVLRQVSVWAAACALAVRAFHVPVTEWRWFWVPVSYLHQALVGLALVTLGVQLSQTRIPQSVRRLSWALGLRLLAGPVIAALLVGPFGFHGEEAIVLIISSSFPTAVNTALLAHEFQADAQFAATAVFYSTMASMLTVTCLIAALRLPQAVALFA